MTVLDTLAEAVRISTKRAAQETEGAAAMKVAAHVAALVLLYICRRRAGTGAVAPGGRAPSRLTRLVPAEAVEGRRRSSSISQAGGCRKGALVAPGDPRLRRLRARSRRIIPQALQFNACAAMAVGGES